MYKKFIFLLSVIVILKIIEFKFLNKIDKIRIIHKIINKIIITCNTTH